MYYLIYRLTRHNNATYMLYSTAGYETPWCINVFDVLTKPLTDRTGCLTAEDRVFKSNWTIYGPYTDRPTPKSHPELLI